MLVDAGNTKGGSITVPLTSCSTGLDQSVLWIKANKFQLSYSWFQTSQTGGQWYSDTSPLVFPGWCFNFRILRFRGSARQNSSSKLLSSWATGLISPKKKSWPSFITRFVISLRKSGGGTVGRAINLRSKFRIQLPPLTPWENFRKHIQKSYICSF